MKYEHDTQIKMKKIKSIKKTFENLEYKITLKYILFFRRIMLSYFILRNFGILYVFTEVT